jgi:hypothetical protein
MPAKWNVLVALAALLLVACESPRPAPPVVKPEVLIQAPAEKVRAAVKSTLVGRGYVASTPDGETLVFDRTGDYGSSVMQGALYDKQAWRRIRIALAIEGAATRLTARGAVLTNRGLAYEREEPDTSAKGAQQLQAVLEQIRERVLAGN